MTAESGNANFDKFLGGGYADCITIFYGAPSTGKSTFCLMAAVQQLKLNKKVIYLDSENGFSVERFKQLVGNNYNKLLENIFMMKINNFKDQQQKIKDLTKITEKNIGIVIFDGIGTHYRRLVIKKPELANSMLFSQFMLLKEIAKNIPVIATNQIYSDINNYKNIMIGSHIIKKMGLYLIELKKIGNKNIALSSRSKNSIIFEIVDSGIVTY